jgi:hypothetical protein
VLSGQNFFEGLSKSDYRNWNAGALARKESFAERSVRYGSGWSAGKGWGLSKVVYLSIRMTSDESVKVT